MSKPLLYGVFASPYVRKTRLALAFKGIEYDNEPTFPGADDAAFRQASPRGKIPGWRDEHGAFSDSAVIIQYLEQFYPGPKLIPDSPYEFARTLWFQEYADDRLVPIFAGGVFAEVILAKPLFEREKDQAKIDQAINVDLPEVCVYLEQQIKGKDNLVGDSITLADIAIAGVFQSLYHAGYTVDAKAAPALSAYLQNMYGKPPFADLAKEDAGALKQMMGWESPLA